jgi:hypothetical protein
MISLRVSGPRLKMSFMTLRAYLFDATIGKALRILHIQNIADNITPPRAKCKNRRIAPVLCAQTPIFARPRV